MATADEFGRITAVLCDAAPPDADISSVDLRCDGGRCVVTVQTRTPGRLIGGHGAAAARVRAAMAERLGDAQLQLNIVEMREDPPPDGPPPDGIPAMYPAG
jgi:ribosomal protein S3